MKIISPTLDAHLASKVTTIANCWKLTRRDAVVIGFTDHDRNVVFDDVTYYAASGFTPSAIASNSELAVDHLDVEGVLDNENITEGDIKAGLYDFAEIEIFIVNYENLTQGALILRTGWLGEVKYSRSKFVAEVRGLLQNLSQNIGELYSPSCRAKLGDLRCKIDIEDFTYSGSITAVVSNQIFIDSTRSEDNGWFNGGEITFTSGNNDGLKMEVKGFRDKQITLMLPMPYDVENSDTYSIIAGCDKSFDTCIAKFNNAINFRGEPHVPGIDKMLQTAGTI
jgi:uncharacterized phage protein (TIGR02218 family)